MGSARKGGCVGYTGTSEQSVSDVQRLWDEELRSLVGLGAAATFSGSYDSCHWVTLL